VSLTWIRNQEQDLGINDLDASGMDISYGSGGCVAASVGASVGVSNWSCGHCSVVLPGMQGVFYVPCGRITLFRPILVNAGLGECLPAGVEPNWGVGSEFNVPTMEMTQSYAILSDRPGTTIN
jgi:hypothetical protein